MDFKKIFKIKVKFIIDMENTKMDKMDQILKIFPGGVFGLISVIIILSGDIISIVLFPGGYSFFENMISELGRGPYGIFFNLGVVISGIVSVPYYISLYRSFDVERVNPILRKSAIIFSLISIITYVLIGVFPSIEENYIILITHGTFAFISLASGAIYLTLFSILMLRDSKYMKLQAYYGFIVAGTYVLFLLTWWPITEWIATFAIISWIAVNSLYMLYYKL